MINLTDCMDIGCANALGKKHRDHVKEAKKKDKNHICTNHCQSIEHIHHMALHEWYQSSKK